MSLVSCWTLCVEIFSIELEIKNMSDDSLQDIFSQKTKFN